MKIRTGFTCNAGGWKAREGMTLVELLVVIAIIGLLAGILVPAVARTVRVRFKVNAIRVEIKVLEAAMVAYYADWGVYPPDQDVARGFGSGASLVHFLGTKFRTSALVGSAEYSSRNSGPYFVFPVNRLVDIDNDGDGKRGEDPIDGIDNDGDSLTDEDPVDYCFVDLLGDRPGVSFYRFDNNEAEDGSEDWLLAGNVSNVHPTAVDIWSAGEDSVDEVSTKHPTRDTVADMDLGDDIGNW